MINNRRRILALKHISYVLLFVLLFVLQSTPHFLTLRGVQPMLLIPAAVALAMYEGGFTGGLYGALAGMLCDLGAFSFYGLYSLLLLVCAVLCGLLVTFLMQRTMRVALLLTAGTAGVCMLLRFAFDFGLWGYADTGLIFRCQSLPTLAYTVLFTPAFFFLQGKLTHFFDSRIGTEK